MNMVIQKSIKKNFMYNTLLKILNMIFPLITFPYVARILTAEGVGKVDFSLSVIQYFILIAQIGIPTYAIRECAKHRDDREKLSKTVQEILVINALMIFIAYLLFFITMFSVNKLANYQTLLMIMSINIITTSIGIEWFYQAIEEYRYITIRSLFVKLLSLILVFTFIKQENDYVLYGLITVLSVSLGNIFNIVHVNKYITLFKRFKNYNFKRHIKPIVVLFAMSLSISIYVNLDTVMLGFISGDHSVGLYAAANKILKVVLALVTSLGVVLLPRMSYYIQNNAFNEINKLIKKSLDFILMISIPAVVGIFMLAEPIIYLFAGNDYTDAVLAVKIMSPIIIAMGLSNLIGIQVLISHGREKITLISTIIGAFINFSLNIVLISRFQQNGAAIGTLIAEVAVIITQIIFAYSFIKGNINFKNILNYIVGGILIVLTCVFVDLLNYGLILTTLLSIIISVIIYVGFLYGRKNELIYELINKLVTGLKHRIL